MGIVNLDKLTFWRVRPICEHANGLNWFFDPSTLLKAFIYHGIRLLCGSYLTSNWTRLLGGLMDILSVHFVVVLPLIWPSISWTCKNF